MTRLLAVNFLSSSLFHVVFQKKKEQGNKGKPTEEEQGANKQLVTVRGGEGLWRGGARVFR